MFVFETRKRSRWWTETVVVLLLTMSLTFSPCLGLEDNAQSSDVTSPWTYFWAEVNYTYRQPETNKQLKETAEGKYGMGSLVEQRTGLVMHIHDKSNKSQGCTEYTNKIPQVPWIALIQRGGCIFTKKIKMATQTYNATAVVIYNHEQDEITIMKHDVKTQVSISILAKTGVFLAELVDSGVKVEMTITPRRRRKETGNGPGSHNSISKSSVLFVSISFIVFMIISLAWLVFYCIQRFRYAHAKERLAAITGTPQTEPLDPPCPISPRLPPMRSPILLPSQLRQQRACPHAGCSHCLGHGLHDSRHQHHSRPRLHDRL